MGKVVYVHFSFRRPSHKRYGIFAAAFYCDLEGKKFMGNETRAFTLWKDQQYITAIQSYEHALFLIWEHQKTMMDLGVTDIYLVTDNSTLAGWIENPNKRPEYAPYMRKANKRYLMGGERCLRLNIGLCEPQKAEKSYKFCRENLIQNKRPIEQSSRVSTVGMKRVKDIINGDKVKYSGIKISDTGNNEIKDSEVSVD